MGRAAFFSFIADNSHPEIISFLYNILSLTIIILVIVESKKKTRKSLSVFREAGAKR
ncbi:MAG: hypothetical protein FWF51_08090 [Chitinivibrionia bacterium]|nr:hypothetical protein [Chitinivibrionia bacterium]